MKISMICLSMGRFNIVKECFPYIIGNSGRPPDEIVWVDNGSKDGTAEFARENSDICVLNKKNLGATHGFNTAWALATGELIVQMIPYVKPPKNWLKIMEDVYTSANVDGVCIYLKPVQGEPGRFRGGVETHAGYKCQRALFIELPLFRKDIADRFGYYDEALDPYWPSDVEYAFRVDHHGFKALAIDGIHGEHCGHGNDVEPLMPHPQTGAMIPYFEWKKLVQWTQAVHDRINENATKCWPIIGFNQKQTKFV